MGNNQKTFELGRMDIVDIYEWIEGGKIITGPVFQRLSVWKNKDREELIDTIMNGFPIPAIFICEGSTDFKQIGKKYVVLDGKQRLESISLFLKNELKYNGYTFGELSEDNQSKFLNFSLPVVQMYVDVHKELDKVQEIFKRLNKNSYNLNEIEKSLSQYIDYDFINISKILCSYIEIKPQETEFDREEIEEENESVVIKSDFNEAYFVKEYINTFFSEEDTNNIQTIFSDLRFFTTHEQNRQKSIQHLINIFGALIKDEHVGRNVKGTEYETYSDESFITNKLFPIITRLNTASNNFLNLFSLIEKEDLGKLKKFWFSKSNLYTFLILLFKFDLKNLEDTKNKLLEFSKATNTEDIQLFKDYRFACTEAVNSKKARELRENILIKVLDLSN